MPEGARIEAIDTRLNGEPQIGVKDNGPILCLSKRERERKKERKRDKSVEKRTKNMKNVIRDEGERQVRET